MAYIEPTFTPATSAIEAFMDARAAGRGLRSSPIVADVEGHTPYLLGDLIQFYGEQQTRRLASGIEKCLYGQNEDTAKSKFYAWYRFMFLGGFDAAHNQPGTDFFRMLRDGVMPLSVHLNQALQRLFTRLSDFDNFSVTLSNNDRTRSAMWDGCKSLCKLLADVNVFPESFVQGTIKCSGRNRVPVLCDLSREASRFRDIPDIVKNEEAILKENTELLSALREELERTLVEALQDFRQGVKWCEETPDAAVIDEILRERGACDAYFGPEGSDYRKACAVKLIWAIHYTNHDRACWIVEFYRLCLSAGGLSELRKYLGATPRALTAAYHIIIMDTAWNPQPCDCLAADPFIGNTQRGKKRLRSIGGVKVRAGEKEIEGQLEEPSVDFLLPIKRSDVRLSGVQVIEAWQEMSKPLRDKALMSGDNQAADRLWIWKERSNGIAQTNLKAISRQWWYETLAELSDHPRIGKLPINRRILRKTVANIEAVKGSFSHQLPMALLDHTTVAQSKMYLTEQTIEALFEAKMRQYLDLLEAVTVSNVDQAAILLGVPEEELVRRRQIGLASGLAFAHIRAGQKDSVPDGDSPTSANDPEILAEDARVFVPTQDAMEDLHIARTSLAKLKETVAPSNPGRWIRTWLTWHAIVEAIARQLEASRFRLKFKKACDSAQRKLDQRLKAAPAIW